MLYSHGKLYRIQVAYQVLIAMFRCPRWACARLHNLLEAAA